MRNRVVKYTLMVLVWSVAKIMAMAQTSDGVFTTGVRVGANYVSMTNLKQTFCTDDNQPTYEIGRAHV